MTRRRSSVARNLRVHAPGLYKAAVHTRRGFRYVGAANGRRQADKLFDRDALTIDISVDAGLGGLLDNAARALHAGHLRDTEVALRFSSLLYMPTPAVDDWLESYFVRLGAEPRADAPTIDARSIGCPMPARERGATLVWNYMTIAPSIADPVADLRDGRYAAVHFRGSDKFLEVKPVTPVRVLDRVEEELAAKGLDRLFVASDEQSFIDQAKRRFGDSVAFSLPQEAVAVDGVPAHFSDVPGQIKAKEALQTMLVLAGSTVCVRSSSLLSQWAQTLADPAAEFIELFANDS